MTEIVITLEGDETIALGFKKAPMAIRRATSKALRKTLTFVERDGRRRIARNSDIPQSAFRRGGNKSNASRSRSGYKGRVFKTQRRAATSGRVWFGLNPVKSGYVGKGRNVRTKGGARVRSHFFLGAFTATVGNGHQGIFRRTNRVNAKGKKIIEETKVKQQGSQAILALVAKTAQGIYNVNFSNELRKEVDKIAASN